MKRVLLFLIASGWLATAQASAVGEGDAKAGESKAAACAACHGPAGNSFNPVWPKLAGQGAPYIVKQLTKFKSGERMNPVMGAQVANLSEQDMLDIAAYYAQQKTSTGAAVPELAVAGEKLYRGGNPETAVPACLGCHGPKGEGVAGSAYPRIGGQQPGYSEAQLRAYRDGSRKAPMMTLITARMTDDEMKALASYVAGLH
ncbi:MAG: c-type cytochrome [Nevskiales bacterium]